MIYSLQSPLTGRQQLIPAISQEIATDIRPPYYVRAITQPIQYGGRKSLQVIC